MYQAIPRTKWESTGRIPAPESYSSSIVFYNVQQLKNDFYYAEEYERQEQPAKTSAQDVNF